MRDAYDSTAHRRAQNSHLPLHVRRGDHSLAALHSPLWLLLREADQQMAALAEGAAAATGVLRVPHRRIQPLLLLAPADMRVRGASFWAPTLQARWTQSYRVLSPTYAPINRVTIRCTALICTPALSLKLSPVCPV